MTKTKWYKIASGTGTENYTPEAKKYLEKKSKSLRRYLIKYPVFTEDINEKMQHPFGPLDFSKATPKEIEKSMKKFFSL